MEKKTEMTFLEKVAAVQAELKAPKSQRNDFGKYNYRSCEDIFEAVKPLLAKYGLVLVCSDELENIGERYYIHAKASLIDASDMNKAIINHAYAREEETKKGMDGSQITGASSSYARKYALNGLFLIDDTRDSDATNTHGKEEPVKEEKKAENKLSGKKASAKQIELIKTLVPEKDLPAMLKWAGVEKIEDMPLEAASKVITEKTKKKED